MGSGAFLVQAIRYLSKKLVESWTKSNSETDENITLPYGDISHGADNEELLPSDETEALQRAKLYVAQNCIYGVDKNPMAVELAKVSLWLHTARKDKPLSFLDHHLKWGNSLVGAKLEDLTKPGVKSKLKESGVVWEPVIKQEIETLEAIFQGNNTLTLGT